jgi:hypothetical protein
MKLLMLGIESHDHDEIAAISKGTLLVNRDYQNWNAISPWVVSIKQFDFYPCRIYQNHLIKVQNGLFNSLLVSIKYIKQFGTWWGN